ncbi:hypothetical protein IGI04_034827 [Brassica rapa subsp. trilocularis]|uniref:RNase H type-1 domain-containing protein n=1 Tax=Brassica rapa subsp. trilocularis TaxID=1813537 RepID=A0ABQ7L9V8_BRACM|nr:hypothetical protein IGI04_034827 [Brassica rapa subsp. trilocularis]
MYHPTTISLKVSDLLVEHTNFWNLPLLRQTFAADDVNHILSIKAKPHLRDSKQWGFNPYGSYTSQSGYPLVELINELQNPSAPMPPIEKRLWSLSCALAVKANLRSRDLQVEAACAACGHRSETVCDVLFTFPEAQDVSNSLENPLPPTGFSQTFSSKLKLQTPQQPSSPNGRSLHHEVSNATLDPLGRATFNTVELHGRRSYSRLVSPILYDILSLHWAVERMVNLKQTRIIFEFSLPALHDVLAHPDYHPELYQHFETLHTLLQRLDFWCFRLAPLPANKAALEIATSY